MIYYITKQNNEKNHAGVKAPQDIDKLCHNRGWQRLAHPFTFHNRKNSFVRLSLAIRTLLFWIGVWVKLKKGDVVFYQHPMKIGTKVAYRFISTLKKNKGVRFIALIHDLNVIRFKITENTKGAGNMWFEDCIFLKVFNVLICHNRRMYDYLVAQGFDKNSLVILGAFDYLINAGAKESACDDEQSLVVAGNLGKKKAGYLYLFANENTELPIYAYGLSFAENESPSIRYEGVCEANELPSALKGGYGLIWDGNSTETCAGEYGEYLRFNNPHKMSLYIASGKPVICWRQAAIAEFVLENRIGFAVDSLAEIPAIIKNTSHEEYQRIREAVLELRQKVITGGFFYSAIDESLRMINLK